jgi:hypothetical protein
MRKSVRKNVMTLLWVKCNCYAETGPATKADQRKHGYGKDPFLEQPYEPLLLLLHFSSAFQFSEGDTASSIVAYKVVL